MEYCRVRTMSFDKNSNYKQYKGRLTNYALNIHLAIDFEYSTYHPIEGLDLWQILYPTNIILMTGHRCLENKILELLSILLIKQYFCFYFRITPIKLTNPSCHGLLTN
jgi:hypothetical protein